MYKKIIEFFLIALVLCNLMVADVCAEKNENIGGDVSYTIQDFLVYMQHGYTDYNIFGTYATSDALFVTNDSMLEYRKIDTDTISVSGKIAVVCDLDNSMDDNKSDSISCLIENNKSEYLNKIYQGSNIPDTISLSYLDCDDLKVPEFQGFDLYIFEKSALEGEITEEVFLKLDELLKQGEATYIYNIDIVKNSFATGERDGSNMAVIEQEDSDEYTILLSNITGNSFIGADKSGGYGDYIKHYGSAKYKDSEAEKSNYRSVTCVQYLVDMQKMTSDNLLYNSPYTKVKILPTYHGKTLNAEFFRRGQNSRREYAFLRYVKCVFLPSSIKNIPEETFKGYDVLEDVNLENINSIGENAFWGCKSLKDVTFCRSGNVSIGCSAFQNCGLTQVEIPDTVNQIGSQAFSNNYITDSRSLLNNVYNYKDLEEYKLYQKDHIQKILKYSMETIVLNVPEEGVKLGTNTFYCSLEEDFLIPLRYKESISPIFLMINQENKSTEINCISAKQLNDAVYIKYVRQNLQEADKSKSPNATTESNSQKKDNEGKYVVTLLNTAYTTPKIGTLTVSNGETWSEYLKKYERENRIFSFKSAGLEWIFNGWKFANGKSVNYNETIKLDHNVVLKTEFTVEGDLKDTVKIEFYGYKQTVDVVIGTALDSYKIPRPSKKGEIWLGWSRKYPISSKYDVITNSDIIKSDFYNEDGEVVLLYPIYEFDLIDKRQISATEKLEENAIYRLNANNKGIIYQRNKLGVVRKYRLDQTNFNSEDKRNAHNINSLIIQADKNKVAILPKDSSIDVSKLKKQGYTVVKTGLIFEDYIAALTYSNCRYFQYLQLVQTPYFVYESELKSWNKDKDVIGYGYKVEDFILEPNKLSGNGFLYLVDRDKFKNYYNICSEMETKLKNIANRIGLYSGMSVTQALWKISELCINDYAYDNWMQIYDLNWFLKVTDENRNENNRASYHGVCASYSKLAYALLGMYGYEALPTAVGSGDNPTHSVTKVVLDGKIYYCDYTWIGENDTDRYMFMTNDNMIFRDHKNPISDDMGQKIAYNRIERNLSKIKIDKIKNKRNNKISISFTDLKTDGYELQYTTDKKFKKTKQKIATRSNVTIIGLRKRKKYYVRVRPYGVIYMSCINGKSKKIKYYGKWSKTKSVIIKR